MKASKIVILAAGKGVRFLPLTENIPKPLIKVRGEPFLHFLLKRVLDAGYKDIGLVVGHKKERIKEFLDEKKINATLIEQEEPLGTGDAVKSAKDFAGDDDFVVVGGDNLWSSRDLSSINRDDGFCYVGVMDSDTPEKFGVIIEEKGFLKEIIEKPESSSSSLVNTGLYKFSPEIFDALGRITRSERGEYELTDAINLLAKNRNVKVFKLGDYWIDFGSKQDIPKIEQFLENQG